MSNKPKTLRLNKWGTVFSKLIAKKYAIYNLHVNATPTEKLRFVYIYFNNIIIYTCVMCITMLIY